MKSANLLLKMVILDEAKEEANYGIRERVPISAVRIQVNRLLGLEIMFIRSIRGHIHSRILD